MYERININTVEAGLSPFPFHTYIPAPVAWFNGTAQLRSSTRAAAAAAAWWAALWAAIRRSCWPGWPSASSAASVPTAGQLVLRWQRISVALEAWSALMVVARWCPQTWRRRVPSILEWIRTATCWSCRRSLIQSGQQRSAARCRCGSQGGCSTHQLDQWCGTAATIQAASACHTFSWGHIATIYAITGAGGAGVPPHLAPTRSTHRVPVSTPPAQDSNPKIDAASRQRNEMVRFKGVHPSPWPCRRTRARSDRARGRLTRSIESRDRRFTGRRRAEFG